MGVVQREVRTMSHMRQCAQVSYHSPVLTAYYIINNISNEYVNSLSLPPFIFSLSLIFPTNTLGTVDTDSSIDYYSPADNVGRVEGKSEKTLLQMTSEERTVTVLEIACLPMEIDDDIGVLLRMCGPFGSVMQAHFLDKSSKDNDDTIDVNMVADDDGLLGRQGQGGHMMGDQGGYSLVRARVHMRGARNAKRCAAALDGLVLFERATPLKVTVLG